MAKNSSRFHDISKKLKALPLANRFTDAYLMSVATIVDVQLMRRQPLEEGIAQLKMLPEPSKVQRTRLVRFQKALKTSIVILESYEIEFGVRFHET